MYCPYCKATVGESALVCSQCGKNIGSVKKESKYSCSHCGKDVPEDAAYCWNCSISLEEVEDQSKTASASLAAGDTAIETKPPIRFKTLKANRKIMDESVCGICNNKFTIGEDINQCENCHTFYHQKCWDEKGGCVRSTCREEMKECPFCGKEIKKSALKCRYCGQFMDSLMRDRQIPKGKLKEASEALTYAIIGIFCFGIILGPIAISKGNKAIKKIDSEPGWEGRGSAQAAVIIGWIVTVLYIIAIIARISSN